MGDAEQPRRLSSSRMDPLDTLVEFFVQTFGITRPTETNRRRAGWLILCLMTLAVALLITVGIVGYDMFHASRY